MVRSILFLLLGVILSNMFQIPALVACFSIGDGRTCRYLSPTSSTLFTHGEESSPSSSSLPELNNSEGNRKLELVHAFVRHVQQSVEENTFVSLTLQGTAPKKKKKQQLTTEDPYRGSIRQVQGRLIQMKKKEKMDHNKNTIIVLLQLTIKYHGATDICKNMAPEEIFEKLAHLILEPLASEWGVQAVQAQPFQGAELKTLHDRWELKALHPGNQATLQRKMVLSTGNSVPRIVPPASHDRTKQVPLAHQTTDTTFLQVLGLSTPDGSPRPGMSSKLRQCNKFVEIVLGLVEKAAATTTTRDAKNIPIRVVDMGCGRAYLTFSLHSSLSVTYPNVKSLGIDVRPKLVAEISGIAQSLGGPFDTLSFQTGTIDEIVAGTTSIFRDDDGDGEDIATSEILDPNALDILIALHACDTATDDALWSGISQGADVIVVAPCCHKEVRPQLNAHVTRSNGTTKDHPLYDVLRHGVYRERISETVTDSLRALLLEQAGYKVQVFEFIGGEHTSKNVMITAIKSPKLGGAKNEDGMTTPKNTVRIQELASFHGITQQKLAQWMGLHLGSGETTSSTVPSRRKKWSPTQMPARIQS